MTTFNSYTEHIGNRSFYHYIVSSWIRAKPKSFIGIIKRYKDWTWLKGEPTFVQMEWRHPETLMFYDVYMKVLAPYKDIPNKLRYYHVFIEIKTGKYNDDWVTQLKTQYVNRKSSKLGYRHDDYPQLLFIARKTELTKLKRDLGSYPTSYLLFFELDYLEPVVLSDAKSVLEPLYPDNKRGSRYRNP